MEMKDTVSRERKKRSKQARKKERKRERKKKSYNAITVRNQPLEK